MVKYMLVLAAILASQYLPAQTLTLDRAIEQAREQYPLLRQKSLLKQTAELHLDNLSKAYWPQLQLNAQASYQSDVTELSVPIPGFKMDPVSKDQYKLVADLNQLIYDGGIIRTQKELNELQAVAEDQKLEVELYQLNERVTQIYLGILLLDKQLEQNNLVQQDLQSAIATLEAQVENGLVLPSHLYTVKAEALKADQKLITLQSNRKGLLDVLGLFLNESLPGDIELAMPVLSTTSNQNIRRPELKSFNDQESILIHQKKLVGAKLRPKTSAFLQAGYGRPGLNMLKNEFDPFYIVGVRFNWNFGGLYTASNERKLLDINRQSIDIQRQVFLLQTEMKQKQQLAEVEKWNRIIATDREILDLRTKIKVSAKAQLENQVITAADFLREVNAEDAARQNLFLHELELLLARINYDLITGNKIQPTKN